MPKRSIVVDPEKFEPREAELRAQGYDLICGVDEAGRGPLAGDVYAAAVILPPGWIPAGLDDSKKLTPAKREELFDLIRGQAVAFSIALATVEEIEELNILWASLLAMRRAVKGLDPPAEFALVDGNMLPKKLAIPGEAVVGGDARIASVAAASILAKVARDHAMLELDAQYAGYDFARHKGYGTARHYEALARLGPCPAHRKAFLPPVAAAVDCAASE